MFSQTRHINCLTGSTMLDYLLISWLCLFGQVGYGQDTVLAINSDYYAASAESYLQDERLDLALAYAEQGLENILIIENPRIEIRCLMVKGEVQQIRKEIPDALKSYLRALRIWENIEVGPGLFDLKYRIAQLYEDWGVHEKAFEYYQEAYQNALQWENESRSLRALEGMADRKYALGAYKEALAHLQVLQDKYRARKDSSALLKILRQTIRVQRDTGLFHSALQTNQLVLALNEDLKDTTGIIVALNNIGFLYRQLGEIEDALAHFSKSLEVERAFNSNKKRSVITLTNLGVISHNLGEPQGALAYLKEAETILLKGPDLDPVSLARLNNLMAVVHLSVNEVNNAYKYNQHAIELALGAKLDEIELESYHIRSQIYEQVNDYRQSLYYYQKYAELKDSLDQLALLQKDASLQKQFSAEQTEKAMSLLVVDREIKALEYRQAMLQTEKLTREKALQESIIKQQELEKEQAQQALLIANQKLLARAKDEAIIQLEKEQAEQQLELARQRLDAQREITQLQQDQDRQQLALQEIALEEQQKQQIITLQERDLKEERIYRNFALVMAILSLVILALTIRNNTLRKKANKILAAQKKELEHLLDDLKNTQTQLVQSEKMASLGQLTAGIAHEINNPINFVITNAHALKLDLDEINQLLRQVHQLQQDSTPAQIELILQTIEKLDTQHLSTEIQELIASIERGADRTKNIVMGLRTFSRSTGDQFVEADLHEGLDSTLTILNSKLKSRIEVIRNYGPIPLVPCQFDKINQVFMNMLSNAIQAIDGSGKILISTSAENGTVAISIEDTGKGMDEATKKRIFEPFFTTKGLGEGLGLGLSISYGIIEQHSGTLKVNSELGKGTEFVINLPIERA